MNEVDGRSRVNLYCPEYDSGTTQGPDLCCDGDQMIEMEPIFRTVQQFFARCPACQINLLNIFCNLLCSVDQSIFINATELIPALDGKQGATAISFFLSKETAYEMFDSCKDVQFPAANTKVMDLMCGGYTGDDCTPERWLAFFGTPTNGFTPFQIDFILLQTGEDHPILDEGMAPLDEYAEDCAVPSSSEISACSCQDCDAACPPLPTAPPEEQPYEIANIDGYTFIVLMVFLGLLLVLVTLLVLGNLYSKESKNSIDVAKESQSMKKPMKKRELAIVIPSEVGYKVKSLVKKILYNINNSSSKYVLYE